MDNTLDSPPRFCQIVDRFILKSGKALAWLNVILIVNILIQVTLRYAFNMGLVWLEELQWHLYGAAIMFAISYCITEDAHIRLDLLHQRLTPRTRAVVEVLGILLLLFPLYITLCVHGVGFVESALRVHERSDSPLGLPYRWIIKSAIPVGMSFVIAAATSRLVRSIAIIFNKKKV